jgi:hypothetical protein
MEINKREINDDKNKLELEQYSESFFTKIKNKFIRNLKFHYKYIILLTIVLVIILLLPINNKTKSCNSGLALKGGAFENGVQTMTRVTEKILGFYLILGFILLLPVVPVVAYIGLIYFIITNMVKRIRQT